jgi:DtxR family Mn-dependent transcriptional regulator
MKMVSDAAEEILEMLWREVEEKKNKALDVSVYRATEAFGELVEKGMIDTSISTLLTAEGRREAAGCVRRHRLAERLLADVLDVKGDIMHEMGCKLEHGLHYGIEDQICTLLGHPRLCPHGTPIPPGECCKALADTTRRLIVSMRDMKPGETGKIAYVNTEDPGVLKKLLSMGILPGAYVKLTHRYPSYVFVVGETTYAIDEDLASHIHVLAL